MLLGFVLLGASFFLSSHFLPWTGFHHESLAALGAIAIAIDAMRGNEPLRWPAFAWAALALALVPLAQWLGGLTLFGAGAVLASLYLVAFALAIASGARLAQSRAHELLDGLATTFLIVSLGSTIIGAAQWAGVELPLPELIYNRSMNGGRAVANLGQSNQLAACLVWGLVGAAWLYQRKRIRAPLLAAAALLLGFGLVSTQSRSAWVALLVLLAWWAFARRRTSVALPPVGVGAFAAYFLVLAVSWGAISQAVGTEAVRDGGGADAGTRPMIWRYVVEALGDAPWLGYGWGELLVGFGQVAHRMPSVHEMPEYAHNLPLDLMMWNGVPLGALLTIGCCGGRCGIADASASRQSPICSPAFSRWAATRCWSFPMHTSISCSLSD